MRDSKRIERKNFILMYYPGSTLTSPRNIIWITWRSPEMKYTASASRSLRFKDYFSIRVNRNSLFHLT